MLEFHLKKNLVVATGAVQLSVDLVVAQNEFVTLFGESGAGKTILLRMIAGLTQPDEGMISVGDEVWFDSRKKINLPTQRRSIGFVFQDYSLFPHMTVVENLRFASCPLSCRAGQRAKDADAARIRDLLKTAGLLGLQDRRPHQLSGGQNQRVAILRAVLRQPKLLLLDEPFSALDMDMRLQFQEEVFQIHKKFGITTIFVSHHIAEVFRLSDRVAIIEGGRIARSGPPSQVFGERRLSGKFTFTGEVVEIVPDGVVNILTILVGNNLVRTVATDDEARDIRPGEKVVVSSKAFNPVVFKI